MKSNKFIYTIRLSHELCSFLAEEMNLDIFNKKHNFQTKFKASHQKFYEPFRDIQKQQIIVELLLGKFDIFSYENKGIVLAHFPLHHYRFRNYIQIYWSKYKWFTLFEMLLPSRSERGL